MTFLEPVQNSTVVAQNCDTPPLISLTISVYRTLLRSLFLILHLPQLILNRVIKVHYLLVFFCCLLLAGKGADAITPAPKESPSSFSAPWTKPRQLSNFQALLQHSPFSLSSIEESSPLSERYAITGVITINGEEEVFIFDRNDQSHQLVTKTPNEKAMVLIAVIPQEDPNKLKATVSIGGETGTLSELEQTVNKPGIGPSPHFPTPGKPPYPPIPHPPSFKNNSYSSSPNYSSSPSPSPTHYPSAPYSPTSLPHPNDRRTINRPPHPGTHSLPSNDLDDLSD